MNRGLLMFSNTLWNNSFKQIISRDFSSYCSAISLSKIYPNSNEKLLTPDFVPLQTDSKFNGFVPVDKLDISYTCSSGPGGQNVNKRKTKVQVRFKVDDAEWLHPDLRLKLTNTHKSQITKEGFIIIKSDVTRSQHLNLAHCMKLLRHMVWKADEPEKQLSEKTLEKIRRGKEKANRERLMKKRADSHKKSLYKASTINDL